MIKSRKDIVSIRYFLTSVFILTFFFVGCNSGSDATKTVSADRIKVSTLADVTQESDADYDNNKYGLITVKTLKSWLDDWSTNKPSGITGNLIILSGTNGGSGREFIGDSGTGIYSYAVSSSDYSQTRSSGPIATRSMVTNGAGADAFLKKFAIDPAKDMVVVVMGTGSNGGNMGIGRVWYMLRYWGVAQANVSILNGGLDYHTVANNATDGLADSYFKTTATTAPDTGTASVKNLLVDNTILQISLGELIEWVDETTTPTGGYMVWDVRTASEYDGTKTSGGSIFEGHIKGAVHYGYAALLDSTKGYSYRDKATLASKLAVAAPAANAADAGDNATGIGYSATDAANGKILVSHCKTSWRAMVSMLSTSMILGYPHRVYDGAWAEWGDLSNSVDSDNKTGLASDSVWLTDNTTRSYNVTYPTGDNNTGVVPTVINSDAASATAIIDEDKGYKY